MWEEWFWILFLPSVNEASQIYILVVLIIWSFPFTRIIHSLSTAHSLPSTWILHLLNISSNLLPQHNHYLPKHLKGLLILKCSTTLCLRSWGQSKLSHTRRFARNTEDTHHRCCLVDGFSSQTMVSSGCEDEKATEKDIHSDHAN